MVCGVATLVITYSSDQIPMPHGPLEVATTLPRVGYHELCRVKCKIVIYNNNKKREDFSKRCSIKRVQEVKRYGVFGGRSCGKRGSTAYTYYPFI